MKNKNTALITTYSNVFQGEILPTCKTVSQYIKLIEKADKQLPINNTFIIITNPQTQSYEFISKNFKAVTDISPEELTKKGVSGFLKRIHPEDVIVWLELMKELVSFSVTNIALKDRKKLDVQYNYRFKKGNGNYLNILESQVALQLDKEGNPLISMGHYTVFGNEEFTPLRGIIRMLNDDGKYETIFAKNFSKAKMLAKLSTRELEILELLQEKKTSKETADALFVSIHTIDTHRRNIIKKLHLKSTSQLTHIFEMWD